MKEQKNIGLCMIAYKQLSHYEKMWKNDQKEYEEILKRINKTLKDKQTEKEV